MTRINQNSNYWAGNLTGSLDMWWREDLETKKGRDVVALAGYRRAIANFVNIVTSRTDIPVTYNSADESFTDGKKVYLSGNMNEKNFDPNVGLALHEGSHIVHTNFDLLKELSEKVDEHFNVTKRHMSYDDPMRHVQATRKERIKNLLNYVEDRRIDYLTFKSAPGYKNYYHAMYDKYFNFKVINKALKSAEYRELDWDSYIFRIMNFTNENTDLDALPGLREIYRIIDLKNIARLKNTDDALEVSFNIYDEILKHVNIDAVEENDEEGSEAGDGAEGEDEESSEGMGSGSGGSDEGDENEENSFSPDGSGEGTTVDMPELTPAQLKSLENAINKQNELVNGSNKKTKLTKAEKATVKAVEDSGAYNVEVGKGTGGKTHCVVIPRLSEDMLADDYNTRDLYPFLNGGGYYQSTKSDEAVAKGLVIGKMLGKKLKVRNEERTTKWSRQDSGRLDKRIIAELGFDNDRVFKTSYTERYNDAFIHISIDGSGSMSGEKMENAIKSTAAICMAASMAGNIHVQVTYRSTTTSGREVRPLVVVLYDSNINKISHIRKYWVKLCTTGTTPEGLCFEALSKQIIKDASGRDSFFLNYSDGMPYYSDNSIYYSGHTGISHTKNEVEKMRTAGIEILSFFITEGYDRSTTKDDFKKMYGKDATMINPTKVIELAKELNKKFLQK
jgi:cobalamin biosynthesis protein CobT